jgi:hypothetical protein
MRVFLQTDKVPVQPVQVFVTLDQKILDDVTVAYRDSSLPNVERSPKRERPQVLLACKMRLLNRDFLE